MLFTALLLLSTSAVVQPRMNYGIGYPVVNPYFPNFGGGFNILDGLNPDKEPETPHTPQAAKNCRMVEVTEFEGKAIDDYRKCIDIKGYSYNWIIEDMELQGGICRWAGGRKGTDEREGSRGVCLCPATTEKLCTKGRASCYFHSDRKTNEKTCISKPERFYNQLARLLSRRGKKDFSMKIQYGAAGALGYLPMGLQGPSFIGRRNPYLDHHLRMHYGTFGPQEDGNFGFSPNYHYSASRQGFGGYGGYGPQGVYKAGAAAWGNPSSPNAPAFNPFTGYGGYYGPAQFPSPVMTAQSPVQEQQYKAGAAAWGNPSSPNTPAFNPITGYGGYYGQAQFPSPFPTAQSPVQEQQQGFEPVQQSQPGAFEPPAPTTPEAVVHTAE